MTAKRASNLGPAPRAAANIHWGLVGSEALAAASAVLPFRDALNLACLRAGRSAVTALYPSAGNDTAPFSFLMPAFLRHRKVFMPTPDVFVYVDRDCPADPGSARLSYTDRRHEVVVVETQSVEPLHLSEGLAAGLLQVAVYSDVADEERIYQVLRIRAENDVGYELCERANWSPDVFIGVDDGCCGFGGNDGCENVLHPDLSPFRYLPSPPRFWVTDNFRPSPRGQIGVGDRVPFAERIGLEVTKLGLLSSRWGHPWHPLFGATAFRVRTMGVRPSTGGLAHSNRWSGGAH